MVQKAAWNSYSTDDKFVEKTYKLPKEKILAKKAALVSKHNILSNDSNLDLVKTNIHIARKGISATHVPSQKKMKHKEDLSSLDLLTTNKVINAESEKRKMPKKLHAKELHHKYNIKINQKDKDIVDDSTVKTESFAFNPTETKRITSVDEANSFELQEMALQIQSLYKEMKTFEQITGQRSVLADCDEDLDALLSDDLSTRVVSSKEVAWSLIDLVSRSLTHLLKCETDKHALMLRHEEELRQITVDIHSYPDLSELCSGPLQTSVTASPAEETCTPSTRNLLSTASRASLPPADAAVTNALRWNEHVCTPSAVIAATSTADCADLNTSLDSNALDHTHHLLEEYAADAAEADRPDRSPRPDKTRFMTGSSATDWLLSPNAAISTPLQAVKTVSPVDVSSSGSSALTETYRTPVGAWSAPAGAAETGTADMFALRGRKSEAVSTATRWSAGMDAHISPLCGVPGVPSSRNIPLGTAENVLSDSVSRKLHFPGEDDSSMSSRQFVGSKPSLVARTISVGSGSSSSCSLEQVSVTVPDCNVPQPHSAPRHPYLTSNAADKYRTTALTAQLLRLPARERTFDARSGWF